MGTGGQTRAWCWLAVGQGGGMGGNYLSALLCTRRSRVPRARASRGGAEIGARSRPSRHPPRHALIAPNQTITMPFKTLKQTAVVESAPPSTVSSDESAPPVSQVAGRFSSRLNKRSPNPKAVMCS